MTSYVNLLKEKKLTVTPQRLEIVSILASKGHLNIDELYKQLSVNFPSISLATVYKNIHMMLEKLFLSEVQVPNQKNVYELMKEEHAHVICTECSTIVDVTLDVNSLVEDAQMKTHFKLDTNHIVFNGTCSKCQPSL